MKITKQQLKQIIKEEIGKILKENENYVTFNIPPQDIIKDPSDANIYLPNGKPLEGGFSQVMRELEGQKLYDPDDAEWIIHSLENFKEIAGNLDPVLWILKYAGADWFIEEWAKLKGFAGAERKGETYY